MVTLEQITRASSGRIAPGVTSLVAAEQEWLREARPDLCAGYATEGQTRHRLRRLARARTILGFALFQEGQAIGIGTRVERLRIYDPTDPSRKRIIEGPQIDYWTKANIPPETHSAIALSLLAHASIVAAESDSLLAILSEKEQERASGISQTMTLLGEPQHIQIVDERRDYGLAQLEEPLQVFRATPLLPSVVTR